MSIASEINQAITKADLQRMTRRMNELQADTTTSIEQLNALYKEKIEALGQPVTLKDKLNALNEIDETFAKMEERQFQREQRFLENLDKMENSHFEMGKKMKELIIEK